MKVRYLTSCGRPRGPAIQPGDEAQVSKDEAERLIAKGIAEPVGEKTKPKTTTSSKAKTAEKR